MAEIIALGGLTIIYVALSLLNPDPKNPRQHSTRQIRDIARSIKTFGHIVPILIDCHNRIVAGHGRYLAAQFLKMDVVRLLGSIT
jgi:ParB-like chromosome segregation protein Spo0J